MRDVEFNMTMREILKQFGATSLPKIEQVAYFACEIFTPQANMHPACVTAARAGVGLPHVADQEIMVDNNA